MYRSVFAAMLLSVGLTACGNDQANESPAPPDAPTNRVAEDDQEPSLKAEETGLGEIIVDGKGRTVYTYADDDQGAAKSTCAGECLTTWPPVPAPKRIDIDVSGDAGVTKTADGDPQLTYNGWPLYYYSGDAKPGDTNGQGVKGEWWVLNEAGDKVESR